MGLHVCSSGSGNRRHVETMRFDWRSWCNWHAFACDNIYCWYYIYLTQCSTHPKISLAECSCCSIPFNGYQAPKMHRNSGSYVMWQDFCSHMMLCLRNRRKYPVKIERAAWIFCCCVPGNSYSMNSNDHVWLNYSMYSDRNASDEKKCAHLHCLFFQNCLLQSVKRELREELWLSACLIYRQTDVDPYVQCFCRVFV